MKSKLSNFEMLSDKQLKNIKGGNPWIWMVGGYIFGEVVDGVMQGIDRMQSDECC